MKPLSIPNISTNPKAVTFTGDGFFFSPSTTQNMEHITLHYRAGSSDKIYQAAIEPKNNGYLVTFAFGRRGTTLTTGTKTSSPVPYAEAKAIYDKLVKEKTAKGYTVGQDGTPYLHSDKQSTGLHPQLLNPIDDDQVEKFIADPAYWAQEKFDGRRLLVRKMDDQITGINRLGLTVSIPQPLAESISQCPLDLILDGECVGDDFYAFDALLIDGEEVGGCRYGERYLRLMNLLASFQHRHIHLVETHFTTDQKRQALHRMKADGSEGIVFKHTHAPYIAGRPNSGGPQLKFKFVETASFIVGKINAKRSIGLLLFDGDKITSAGNVTIQANHEIPQSGQVVEVRYLYAFQESGSIFQPVYLGVRDDITAEECLTAQLKYKAEPKEKAA